MNKTTSRQAAVMEAMATTFSSISDPAQRRVFISVWGGPTLLQNRIIRSPKDVDACFLECLESFAASIARKDGDPHALVQDAWRRFCALRRPSIMPAALGKAPMAHLRRLSLREAMRPTFAAIATIHDKVALVVFAGLRHQLDQGLAFNLWNLNSLFTDAMVQLANTFQNRTEEPDVLVKSQWMLFVAQKDILATRYAELCTHLAKAHPRALA